MTPNTMSIQQILENTYLVGGAVRDQLLGIQSHDRDWVVVNVTTDDMLANGFIPVGKDFPVFLHPDTKEEYALARKERKTAPGYGGFHFETGHVTLEEDLQRRDLTMNAMALSHSGILVDPFHGQQDLKEQRLRHVSEQFSEDPLRVLRVARFQARYAHRGFHVAQPTLDLMTQLSQSGELEHLTPERVWLETRKALAEQSPDVYFKTLKQVHALHVIFPELMALDGVPQRKEYHPEVDTFIHTMYSLKASSYLTDDLSVRFATLVHDLGKALTPANELPSHKRHEHRGAPLVKQLCNRLKTSRYDRELALKVCKEHLLYHRCFEMTAASLLRLLKRLDCFRNKVLFDQWLLSCEADALGRGCTEEDFLNGLRNRKPHTDFFQKIYASAASIEFRMIEPGLKGAAIGKALDKQREQAIQHIIDNYGAISDVGSSR